MLFQDTLRNKNKGNNPHIIVLWILERFNDFHVYILFYIFRKHQIQSAIFSKMF